ncbi:MAG: sulfatase-like hydrolase/transferase [Armatimonadota bacterium]
MSRPTPQLVIWITTDHMRYDCINAHGNAAMHTPNLDFLVENGVSFEGCYNQNPLCMPSRCSFMTGLYPQQTGVTANGFTLPADFEPTVAGTFKAAGYQTAQIGKLHFQPHEHHDLDPRERNDYGFDIFWLSEESGCYQDAYMTWLLTEHPELVEEFRTPRPPSPARSAESEGRVIEAPWEASHSGWIAEMASQYLNGLSRRAARNFMHLGFYAPHPPLNPTREMFEPYADAQIPEPRITGDEWEDKPEPLKGMVKSRSDWPLERFVNYRRHFYAMVTGVDMALGRVMERLRENDMLDDTLIIFTSDHGDQCGDHGMISKGPHFYEEVTHMPWVMYWPAGFGDQPRRVEGLVEMVDMMPTLLELSGGVVPDVMMGGSYADALLSDEPVDAREDVFSYHEPGHAMLRTEKYKYLRFNSHDTEVLYDLQEDPPEVVNHADDAEYADVLNDMRLRMLGRSLHAGQSPLRRKYRY